MKCKHNQIATECRKCAKNSAWREMKKKDANPHQVDAVIMEKLIFLMSKKIITAYSINYFSGDKDLFSVRASGNMGFCTANGETLEKVMNDIISQFES